MNYCAEHGHSTWQVDGVDTGVCPRCGEVTTPTSAPDPDPITPDTDGPVTRVVRRILPTTTRGAMAYGVASVALVASVAIGTAPAADATPTSSRTVNPYTCTASHTATDGDTANECRAAGWTVRARLVVSPDRILTYSTLPTCTVEDASGGPIPCTWNVDRGSSGNGVGRSLYFTGTHAAPVAHFVRVRMIGASS